MAMPDDSNHVIIHDLSDGNFQRLWSMPGGTPSSSTKAIDTVFFDKHGDYNITLFVSKTDGSGSPSTSKKLSVPYDANAVCTPEMALLTGDCGPSGKCWTFSHDAGAVKVGPSYEDFSWYTSPADGLQAAQYDDGFCFTFENLVFQNRNNGFSIDPWNGYVPKAYDPGIASFTYKKGAGTQGHDQIVLPNDQFMGVWDCDNVLDVIKLTANELVVRGRIASQTGSPTSGWFELHFVPQ